jgi:hypothetical protein
MKIKIIITILLLALTLPMAVGLTYAAGEENETKSQYIIPKPNMLPGLTSEQQKEENAVKKHVGESVIPYVVNQIIGAAVILSFLFLIIGGIRYLLSYGEDEAIGSAKNTIIYALVGLIIALFSYAIVALVTSIELDKDPNPKPTTSFIPAAYAKYDENNPILEEDNLSRLNSENHKNLEELQNLPFANLAEKNSGATISTTLYANLIKLMLGIASILIVISFLVAGTYYVIAQGDEEKITKAKNILIYTLIAVAVIASAYGVTMGVTKIRTQVWQSE